MPLKPYDHTNFPQAGSLGSSAAMRAEFAAIEQGFDTLAQELENGLTGAQGAATLATTKATEAAASASAAQSSASSASANATTASAQRVLAEAAAAQALSAEQSADLAFTSFDSRYLGAKTADPTLDNSGDPLAAGAMYFSTTLTAFRGYTGSAWVTLPATTAGSVSFAPGSGLTANNVQAALLELASIKANLAGSNLFTGRVNVGLGADPNQYGRLGTSNPTLAGLYAFESSGNVAGSLFSTTAGVYVGSITAHNVAFIAGNQTFLTLDVVANRLAANRALRSQVGFTQVMPVGADMAVGNGDLSALTVESVNNSGAEGPAVIAFNRRNTFATYLGLDTDNVLKIGGWSLGGLKHTILHSSNVATFASTAGIGQTWQDVLGSRALNTDYTNGTAKPITVNVNVNSASGARNAAFNINGVQADFDVAVAGTCNAKLSVVVQPGQTYRVVSTGALVAWSEQR